MGCSVQSADEMLRVMDCLDGATVPMSIEMVSSRTGLARAGVKDLLGLLEARGRVRLLSGGFYESSQSRRSDPEIPAMTPAMAVMDAEGIIRHVTQPLVRLWGYEKREDVVGRGSKDFLADAAQADVAFAALRQSQHWSGHLPLRRRDGSVLDLQMAAWLFQGHGNLPPHVLGVFLPPDDDSVLPSWWATDKASRVVVLPEIVVKGLAHDLNNMLTVSHGMLPLLKMGLDESACEMHQTLDQMDKAATQAAEIVRQMLHWVDKPTMRNRVDIARLGMRATKLGLSSSGTALDFHAAGCLPAVECDEGGIFRVIVNLTLNARQAMNEKGLLTVRIDSVSREPDAQGIMQPGFVRIRITDQGVGMSPEAASHLFQNGFTTKQGGSGVGLAISAYIIRDHGGKIGAHSVEGSGTTFEVLLPATF